MHARGSLGYTIQENIHLFSTRLWKWRYLMLPSLPQVIVRSPREDLGHIINKLFSCTQVFLKM